MSGKKLAGLRAFVLVLVLSVAFAATPASAAEEIGGVEAKAAILVDDTYGEVLYEQSAHEALYPASTTKMMTALLVIEAIERGEISLDDEIKAKRKMVDSVIWDASHVSPRIKPDEVLTVEDYLYCVMIESDCACCNILADYTAGSVEAFVERMNSRAGELGCENTHFANTHGYTDPNHYTTAWSLYLIASEAMKHDIFAKIVGTSEYTVPKTNLTRERSLRNTNWLLSMPEPSETDVKYGDNYYYQYAIGVKTGYTSAAGSCLVSCAEKDGRRLFSVVLGTVPQTLEDGSVRRLSLYESIRLLDFGFDGYSYTKYISAGGEVADMPVTGGGRTVSVPLTPVDDAMALLPNGTDYTSMDFEITLYSESVAAPVRRGEVLGEITVVNGGSSEVIQLAAAQDVDCAGSFELLLMSLEMSEQETVIIAVNVIIIAVALIYMTIKASTKRKGRSRG